MNRRAGGGVGLVARTLSRGRGMLIIENSSLDKFVMSCEKNNSDFFLCNVKAEKKLTFTSIICSRTSKVLSLYTPKTTPTRCKKKIFLCYQVKHRAKCCISYLRKTYKNSL